jgi:hypothetical protein
MYGCSLLSRELMPYQVLRSPDEKEAFIDFLQTHFPTSGTYTLPGPDDNDDASREALETGPVATLHILSKRDISLKARTLRAAQIFFTALLIGWILRRARPSSALDSYSSRVIFVVLIGLATAVYNDLADSVWFYHPWRWSLAKAIFHLVSWTAAGLILAWDGFLVMDTKAQTQTKA